MADHCLTDQILRYFENRCRAIIANDPGSDTNQEGVETMMAVLKETLYSKLDGIIGTLYQCDVKTRFEADAEFGDVIIDGDTYKINDKEFEFKRGNPAAKVIDLMLCSNYETYRLETISSIVGVPVTEEDVMKALDFLDHSKHFEPRVIDIDHGYPRGRHFGIEGKNYNWCQKQRIGDVIFEQYHVYIEDGKKFKFRNRTKKYSAFKYALLNPGVMFTSNTFERVTHGMGSFEVYFDFYKKILDASNIFKPKRFKEDRIPGQFGCMYRNQEVRMK